MDTLRPKTAYDLLEQVAQHILAEPARYWQELWVLRGKHVIERTGLTAPSCGTICCRAGWIVALHDGLDSDAINANAQVRHSEAVMRRANEILGVGMWVTKELFDGDALTPVDEYSDAIEDAPDALEPGTQAYAEAGALGIREFMAEHEAALKARILEAPDVPGSQP